MASCPVDCNVKETDSGCINCDCSESSRCLPTIDCNFEQCDLITQLDGCLLCQCSPDYNDENFQITAACLEQIDQCMASYGTFQRLLVRQNPEIRHQLYPQYRYKRTEIDEVCALYEKSSRCVHNHRLEPICASKHRDFLEMRSLFNYCKSGKFSQKKNNSKPSKINFRLI